MKVTYNWLKDFVDVKVGPQKLADKLTMAGLNVASCERVGDDWVYEIEITSNRPDWLSVRGIAHEVAAITNAKLTSFPVSRLAGSKNKINKTNNRQTGKQANRLTITIEDTSGCKTYFGNLIEGVKIGPSPDWISQRLMAVGIRPVNNAVDITNYCLMELGQPLHAFDFDKIAGLSAGYPVNQSANIVVRRAREGEEIVTLDGIKRKLNKEILVIASGDDRTGQPDNRPTGQPIAAAGIMGGQASEVSGQTTRILLESAYFDPVVVRRGTRVLGVSSDSSYRFERGVDPLTVQTAIQQATKMVCDLCGGSLGACESAGATKAAKERKISFDIAEINQILSLDLAARDAENILKKLGCKIKTKKTGISEAVIPSFRRDLKAKEDITEEIARVYGYEKIPLTKPAITPFLMEPAPLQVLEKKVKNILASLGLKEVITYSLVSENDYKKSALGSSQESPALENPLSEDGRLLRSTLVPSLLACIAFNSNHNNKDLEIFESAHVFGKDSEGLALAIGLCGNARATWQKEAKPYTFFDLKGILETVLKESGIKNYAFELSSDESSLEKNVQARLLVRGAKLGILGKVPESVKKNWGIKAKEDVFIAEISLEGLAAAADMKKHFQPFALTPSVFRDISMAVPEKVSYAQIRALIGRHAQGYLRQAAVVDCYQGKEIPSGHLGLTISLEYGSDQKTLTDAEVNAMHQKILESLTKELPLTLR